MKLVVLFSSLLLALSIAPSRCESDGSVIDATCKKTTEYSLCLSTFKSDPRSQGADPLGLAQISLDILLSKANATFTESLKLFESVDPGSSLYRSYGTCVDVYGGSVTRLIPNAFSELSVKKFSDAQQDAAQVKNNALLCGEQFSEPNPLTTGNNMVGLLATMASDIIGSLG